MKGRQLQKKTSGKGSNPEESQYTDVFTLQRIALFAANCQILQRLQLKIRFCSNYRLICMLPILTDSFRFFTYITLKNLYESPIPLPPIPIPILGDCFIQIYRFILILFIQTQIPGIGIGISAHTGYRSGNAKHGM